MIRMFEGKSANDVWTEAAICLQGNDPQVQEQQSRNGNTRELLHAAFSIENPRQRWVISREPAISPAFAIIEVVWIMTGRNDSAFLIDWNTQLPRFVGNEANLHGAYGFRLRQHFGIDQLERACQALHANPDNRQVVLQLWDSKFDLPDTEGRATNADIPCNIVSLLKVRNNKLEWLQVMRSNDLFRGTPYNFIQFTTLQEVLAGWLGIDISSYNHISDSLHIYETDYGQGLIEKPTLAKANTDDLRLDKETSARAFSHLEHCVEELASPDLSEEAATHTLEQADLPDGYRNLLAIVAAEAARRRKWVDTSAQLASTCTNPVLLQIWEKWVSRFNQ